MDVFAFHITLHFIPAPLITMLLVFLLSLAAYGAAASRHTWPAVVALLSAAGVVAVSLALAEPVPDSFAELHTDRGFGLCPVTGHR